MVSKLNCETAHVCDQLLSNMVFKSVVLFIEVYSTKQNALQCKCSGFAYHTPVLLNLQYTHTALCDLCFPLSFLENRLLVLQLSISSLEEKH